MVDYQAKLVCFLLQVGLRPAELYMAAANAAVARRKAADAAAAGRSSPLTATAETVNGGSFVGTHVTEGPPPSPLSDQQYVDFLEVIFSW